MAKIKKSLVDKLEPASDGKDLFVWDSGDGAIKGFGIRMKPSGVASYLVQYRNVHGRTRRLVIGKVGVLTPEDARKLARKKLSEAENGGDPSADRHAARQEITLSELCDWFIKEGTAHIKPSTLEADIRRINCHIKPLLGNRVVKGINQTDIERFQADVASGKTAKPKRVKGRGGHAKGGRSAAARTLGTLSTIMSFAQRHLKLPENPVIGVEKFQDKKNKRFLSNDEIKALGKAMRESPEENKTGIAAIKALLLTGCRRNEVLSLPWKWLDNKASCIRFGDTKTGAQIRPIGASAANHLLAQPKRKDGEKQNQWIFPADRGNGHFIGLPKVLDRICKKADIEDLSLHHLRHTFASVAAEMGFSELTIAGMIGHTVQGVTNRYSHLTDSAITSAADRVSAYIESILDGRSKNAKILAIQKQK